MTCRPDVLPLLWPAFLLSVSACFSPLVPAMDTDPSTGSDSGTASGSESTASDDPGSTGAEDSTTAGPPEPVCGNGIIEVGEACDDGLNDGSYAGCQPGCGALGPYCGDGITNLAEDCDDGDDVDGNGCNVDCVISGSLRWMLSYDGPAHGVDTGHGVAFDSEGNAIVVGSVHYGESHAWVRKHTAEGSIDWTADFNTPGGSASATSVAILGEDSIVFSGGFTTQDGQHDAWIRRITAEGRSIWTETYSSPTGENEIALDLGIDPSGNIYTLLQEDDLPPATGTRTLLRKYTPAGNELWTIGQGEDVRASAMSIGQRGTVHLGGRSGDPDSSVPWIQQLTSDGGENWSATFSSKDTGSCIAVSVSPTGEVACAVQTTLTGSPVAIFSESGSMSTSFVPTLGFEINVMYAIHYDQNGDLLVAGARGDAQLHIWVTKFDTEGSELWTNTHDGPFENSLGWDAPTQIATDAAGNVAVVGGVYDLADTLSNVWVASYAP